MILDQSQNNFKMPSTEQKAYLRQQIKDITQSAHERISVEHENKKTLSLKRKYFM